MVRINPVRKLHQIGKLQTHQGRINFQWVLHFFKRAQVPNMCRSRWKPVWWMLKVIQHPVAPEKPWGQERKRGDSAIQVSVWAKRFSVSTQLALSTETSESDCMFYMFFFRWSIPKWFIRIFPTPMMKIWEGRIFFYRRILRYPTWRIWDGDEKPTWRNHIPWLSLDHWILHIKRFSITSSSQFSVAKCQNVLLVPWCFADRHKRDCNSNQLWILAIDNCQIWDFQQSE